MKKNIKLLFGIAVSILILYFTVKTFRGIKWGQVLEMHFNIYYAVLSMIVYSLNLVIRSLMFSKGLAPDMTFSEGVSVDFIGAAANMIFPFKLGEGVRLTAFPRRFSPAKRGKLLGLSFATDVICIIIFAIATIIFTDFKDAYIKGFILKSSIVLLAIVIFAIAMFITREKIRVRIITFIKEELRGTLLYDFLSWFLIYISIILGIMAIGMDFSNSLKVALITLTATNLAFIIPATPGAIGIFELFVIKAFMQAGYTEEKGVAAGLILHITQYIAALPIGLFLYFRGIKIKNGKNNN